MSKFDERKSVEEKERKLKDAQRRKEAWARSNSDMKVRKQAAISKGAWSTGPVKFSGVVLHYSVFLLGRYPR